MSFFKKDRKKEALKTALTVSQSIVIFYGAASAITAVAKGIVSWVGGIRKSAEKTVNANA